METLNPSSITPDSRMAFGLQKPDDKRVIKYVNAVATDLGRTNGSVDARVMMAEFPIGVERRDSGGALGKSVPGGPTQGRQRRNSRLAVDGARSTVPSRYFLPRARAGTVLAPPPRLAIRPTPTKSGATEKGALEAGPAAPRGPAEAPWGRGLSCAAIGLLVMADLFVYRRSFSVPFVFDDQFAIVENLSIRHLGNLAAVMAPPPEAAGAAGRPLVNLSLAVNFAWGGLAPWGYHLFNLMVHALCGLLVFLTVTLLGRRSSLRNAQGVALAAGLVWSVHPLLSESVVCVIQRDELMGSFFCLATLYGFLQSVDEHRTVFSRRVWAQASVLACIVGTGCKEIIVAAPVIVLVADRLLVSGSFAKAWSQRRLYYCALAATWIPLAWFIYQSRHRGGTVGYGLGVDAWSYLLTQCRAIALYLKLALWPHPLVIDYGTSLVHDVRNVVLEGLLILTLLIGTTAALLRGKPAALLGVVFFALLAPSSSVVPLVSQPVAEHRMYLPMAAISVLCVLALNRWLGRWFWAGVAGICLVLGIATSARTTDYQSERTLVEGSLAADPGNDRAWVNLGTLNSREGRIDEAVGNYRRALQINPLGADTHFNLAVVLDQLKRPDEAVAEYERAVELKPDYPIAYLKLGLCLGSLGKLEPAVDALRHAVSLQPGALSARRALGEAARALGDRLSQAGDLRGAEASYRESLGLMPGQAQTLNNLANALAGLGRRDEAIACYREAIRFAPGYPNAHYNLGVALMEAGRMEEGRAHMEEARRLDAGHP